MNEDLFNITLFAVRNKEGKWFHRKGYGGYGETWVENFKSARIYTRIGHARAVVSFFANTYPGYGTPDLVQLVVGEVRLIDETARVQSQKEKNKKRAAEWAAQQTKDKLLAAERAFNEAKAELSRLRDK